jgi:hypothetical protein
MCQPSPNWDNFELRNIQCFSVRDIPTHVDQKSEFHRFRDVLRANEPVRQDENDLDNYETIEEINVIEVAEKYRAQMNAS